MRYVAIALGVGLVVLLLRGSPPQSRVVPLDSQQRAMPVLTNSHDAPAAVVTPSAQPAAPGKHQRGSLEDTYELLLVRRFWRLRWFFFCQS
jgi:hypothetical protein